MFPFRYYLRASPGYAAILMRLPPVEALPLIEKSLEGFPNAADLVLQKMQRQLELGQYEAAAVTFTRLHKLVPTAPIVQQLCGGRKDCQIQFQVQPQ